MKNIPIRCVAMLLIIFPYFVGSAIAVDKKGSSRLNTNSAEIIKVSDEVITSMISYMEDSNGGKESDFPLPLRNEQVCLYTFTSGIHKIRRNSAESTLQFNLKSVSDKKILKTTIFIFTVEPAIEFMDVRLGEIDWAELLSSRKVTQYEIVEVLEKEGKVSEQVLRLQSRDLDTVRLRPGGELKFDDTNFELVRDYYMGDKHYISALSRNVFDSIDAWRVWGPTALPMDAQQAFKLANVQIQEINPLEGYEWALESISLEPLEKSSNNRPATKWIWAVYYKMILIKGEDLDVPKLPICIFVTMKGEVIEPIEESWKRKPNSSK